MVLWEAPIPSTKLLLDAANQHLEWRNELISVALPGSSRLEDHLCLIKWVLLDALMLEKLL